MIKAEIPFIKNDKFYNQVDQNGNNVTGYELFFHLVLKFKIRFYELIHTFGESEKSINFNFKGDYMISLKEYGNGRYIELYYHKDHIEDFTEKYNYLKEIINEINIK